jgi:hypothetical protein
MGARKSASTSELEQDRRIGGAEEDESIVQQLQKVRSNVTASLFALELIKESSRIGRMSDEDLVSLAEVV